MKQANQLSLFGNQASIARRHFKNITTLCADIIFVLITFIALALINPPLTLGLVFLFALQYGLTAAMLARGPSQLVMRIRDKTGDYVQGLESFNFWSAFLFILVPLLTGSAGNILLAILAFALLRQGLNVFGKVIKAIVSLAGEKQLIDALVFSSQRWLPGQSRARSFHKLFRQDMHLEKIESVLAGRFEMPRPVMLRWQDSWLGGLSTFFLTFRSGPSGRYYQEQVFAPYQRHLIENEETLFTHVRRDALGAPVVRHSFTHGNYHCRLCDYGLGKPPSRTAWNSRLAELLVQLWSIKPPERLVRAYSTSHLFLHERLTPEFLARLALAVGSDKDLATLRALEAALPAVRAALSAMPLYIHNRDMRRSNSALRSDDGVSIMLWGRWRLEPIGVHLPSRLHKAKLSRMLMRVRQRRSDISEMLSPDHLRFAAACRQFESYVADAYYDAALHLVPTILKNPVLASGDIRERAPVRRAEIATFTQHGAD